ncbi:class I SAM-dependent methyltransferase [Flavihumibacter petaseus]|uniref:Methyltransferase n=1 Tax=Flavihumibacter petaseus NBRC 106054 TaxID=1220578 RepID=A0A0E9N176_9BACT|nr:class I SAM-dependent methyltransferase [Flavihumibacter petaseus]GAO43782.1 hypothetical protein FPE01S_02_08880 [Flavihumibacter petaseus NBRC 106054]
MNTLITQDRLDALAALAKQAVQRVPDYSFVAEIGIYKGGSLKVLADALPDRKIVGFDTFEGLPKEHFTEGEVHQPGEFSDTSLEAVTEFVRHSDHVTLIKGLFPSTAEPYAECTFSFVHVDTDFYLSVKSCLEWFWPRLIPGGIMVFDDYDWPNCPGVKKALDEFGQPIHDTGAAYQAYIIKK